MRNLLTTFLISLTSALVLFPSMLAQQTPPKSASTLPAATTKKTTTAKRTPSPTAKPKPVALTTQQDKISYAIGMNMAKTLQRQSLEVEPDVSVEKGTNTVISANFAVFVQTHNQQLTIRGFPKKDLGTSFSTATVFQQPQTFSLEV